MLDLPLYQILLLLLVIGLLLLCVREYIPPCRNFPPGPWGVPILGSMIYVSAKVYKDMMRLAKTYGNVYSLKMGKDVIVVVNGIESVKEVLIRKGTDFADRPRNEWIVELYNPKYEGIGDSPFDDAFQRRRRFSHTTLRGFGFGKVSMESKIMEEINTLLDELKELQGNPCNPGNLLNMSVSNVMCSITFGRRFEYSDPRFQGHMHSLARWFELSGTVYNASALPLLRFFVQKDIQEFLHHFSNIKSFCMDEITAHRSTFDPNNIRDFIDAYIQEAEHQDPDEFTDTQLGEILVDLFSAGTETTATTLKWALLFMILHPGVQERVYEEIHQVIGQHRPPNLNDRQSFPFTEAVLLEVQRIGCIAPMTLPHAALTDTTIGGYNVPKGTQVIPNLWSIHYDPIAWPEPHEFDPSRFYNESSGTVVKHESFLPFSAGRRVCMGEQLAKQELFLYFSSLMQRFKFSQPHGVELPTTEGEFGLTLVPKPFDVMIESRI
ncbi:cytochrome P450 2U1-like [Glandiceps talaboti]